MMLALTFNFMIAATNAWIGKWNRHAVAPSDNFFYAGAIFKKIVKKNAKNENRPCPLPYEEVLEDIIQPLHMLHCCRKFAACVVSH